MGSRDCRHLQGSPDGCLRPLSHARLRTMAALADELETDPGKNILPSAREIAAELDWELAPIPDL
uniref:Uncharacterized protein n=1 Tax=Oryza sativa subsp. japonica TaxID=39947 RepID=Q7XZX7_ORYSJ|nr:hypothetical protein [Oryza sativa Japonica Group]